MPSRPRLTVDQLLRSPGLQLRVLAGADGLDRPISWAHVSELEDPAPWLSRDELIMTAGLAVPRSAAGQRRYLEQLDGAGVSALAVSAQLKVPPLHHAFFATADRLRFPVLEVPLSVPFMAIAQEVAACVITDIGQRLGAQLQVFGALRWIATEKPGTGELFARLQRLSGYRLFLCTAQGKPLLPGVPVPDPAYLRLIANAEAVPPRVEDGVLLPVPAPGGAAGFLLALAKDGRGGGIAVAQHIASVAAIEVARVRHERELTRRQGAETLAELLQEDIDPKAARRRLAHAGFAPGDRLLLVVAKSAAERDDALMEHLDDEDVAYIALRRFDDLCVLVADGPQTTRALDRATGFHLGLSKPCEPTQRLVIALREAQSAAEEARRSECGIVRFGDNPLDRWLPQDPALLSALVENVLGPVLAHDEAKGGTLTGSLFVWLERGRRADRAAAELHIHPNTLAYRLHRFEQLTGRDLTSTSDMVETWLALRAARDIGRL